MSDFADAIMRRLMTATTTEMERIGGEMVEDFRQRTGESYPPPSEPGTPPHQRTGDYRDAFSLTLATYDEQDLVQLNVLTPPALARWLEFATPRGLDPRPPSQPVFDDWKDKPGPRLKASLESA